MCEHCERKLKAGVLEDMNDRCSECKEKIPLNHNECLKKDCNGVRLFLIDCEECGHCNYHRPGAWICENCIYNYEMREKGLICIKCGCILNALYQGEESICDDCNPKITNHCMDCGQVILSGYFCEEISCAVKNI